MLYAANVKLCKVGVRGKDGKPIGKTLRFVSTAKAFADSLERKYGQYSCEEHATLFETDDSSTAYYSRKLARGILDAVKAARKAP